MKTLRLILWNHLSKATASLAETSKDDVILFIEAHHEMTYVHHHKNKLVFLLSAQRHFADKLKKEGLDVHYISLNSKCWTLSEGLEKICKECSVKDVVVTRPGEYRIQEELEKTCKKLKLAIRVLEDTTFFASSKMFDTWASGRKTMLMESFYRMMRKHTGLLMDEDQKPLGGKWNFDHENRASIQTDEYTFPTILKIKPDDTTQKVIRDVNRFFSSHMGVTDDFFYSVTREDAKKCFDDFLTHRIIHFGKYQDAMIESEAFLYHSIISMYLNAGLLTADEVCSAVDTLYRDHVIPIQSAEGFIRQILGWREYIRGIYWNKMPKYLSYNFFDANEKLPDFYWSGSSKMNCIQSAVNHTKKYAYSHHIQRLMITGTFGLLTGVSPTELHHWYLAVYADAHEWVELPNTLGMSQFADGGLLATKPYVCSGSYINKMSNFCRGCEYDVKKKTGEDACPFNYLYWNFLLKHRKKLENNARLFMPYKTLDKMSNDKKKVILDSSKNFLKSLHSS